MVFAGFGALGFLCGKIFPAKPAQTKVAEGEAGEDVTETADDENKEDGNKNASKSFSFSSLLGLIAAICGIVSLYADSNSIHLYRTYQTSHAYIHKEKKEKLSCLKFKVQDEYTSARDP